jgi:hypothetical protein
MPATRHSEAVRAAIEAMDGTVQMARALVAGGRRIDLAGLDRDANALCAALMALDGAEARQLRPALLALRRQLDGLAVSLAED